MVEMLNRMFTKFDAHAALLGLEKLKTIGDAYLCAGGIPVPDPYHHRKIISMGRRMVRSMFELNKEGLPSLPNLDVHIRVGGATGPIRAGVIGLSKACFDVFGEVSEESELMESSGLPDRMQVTDELYHEYQPFSEKPLFWERLARWLVCPVVRVPGPAPPVVGAGAAGAALDGTFARGGRPRVAGQVLRP